MSKALSLDLRTRVLAAIAGGLSCRQAAVRSAVWKPANSAPAMFRDDCVTGIAVPLAPSLFLGADVARSGNERGGRRPPLITPLCPAAVPSRGSLPPDHHLFLHWRGRAAGDGRLDLAALARSAKARSSFWSWPSSVVDSGSLTGCDNPYQLRRMRAGVGKVRSFVATQLLARIA
jgi:hypothetical protein